MERIDGKRLEAIRNYRGMSISDVTRKTGVSFQTIASIETGFTKGPQFTTLSKICHALRCKVSDVIVNEKG
jgi:DNA-binding Xre family transcriptional regulator